MTPLVRSMFAIPVAVAAITLGDAGAQKPRTTVDLELVLAVDISRSMDEEEHALQRDGYVSAFRHKDVINALVSGPHGRIAVTYLEWANDARQVIPWTIIDSAASANAFADRLAAEPIYGERRTSISTALYEAEKLISENDIASIRQVIDVSGDGANNARNMILRDIQELTLHWYNYATKTDRTNLSSFKNCMALGQTHPLSQGVGVTLSTVHTMKGQEYEIVFLMGMDDETFPDYRSIRGPKIELTQEKNNLYVAFTRAKRFLFVTWPKMRTMPWGETKYRRRSRFLDSF